MQPSQKYKIEQSISKRENALQKAKDEFAAGAFLHAHEGSNYLREPFHKSRSGMGISKAQDAITAKIEQIPVWNMT